MYGDSWRMLRDYFYDKNMHGLGEGRDARIEGDEQIIKATLSICMFLRGAETTRRDIDVSALGLLHG